MDETFDPMLGYVKPHPYYKDIQVSSLGMVRIFDPGRLQVHAVKGVGKTRRAQM